jgi:hypothetical protein
MPYAQTRARAVILALILGLTSCQAQRSNSFMCLINLFRSQDSVASWLLDRTWCWTPCVDRDPHDNQCAAYISTRKKV